jgi:hypothetical protein
MSCALDTAAGENGVIPMPKRNQAIIKYVVLAMGIENAHCWTVRQKES